MAHNHEWFLENQIRVHGDNRYLTLGLYKGTKTKIKIQCLKCNHVFDQRPGKHINSGQGCPICAIEKRAITKTKTDDQFRKEAELIHGFNFTYLTKYKKGTIHMTILCNTCQHQFEQKPDDHLQGSGCPICAGNILKTHEQFVKDQYDVHGEKYTTISQYITSQTKILIQCNTCGFKFDQTPAHHLQGVGCPSCAGNMLKTHEGFINECIEIHGDSYTYIESYNGDGNKIWMIHNYCGFVFEQTPSHHIRGVGCPKCKGLKIGDAKRFTHDYYMTLLLENRVDMGKFYIYDNTIYTGMRNNISVYCPTCSKTFEQNAGKHLYGNSGCPTCRRKLSIGATRVKLYLENNDTEFELEKRFSTCRYINTLPFDFYLPNYDILIEYDGKQHFDKRVQWGQDKFEATQRNDSIKTQWCLDNNVPLIRVKYDVENIEEYLEQELAKITH